MCISCFISSIRVITSSTHFSNFRNAAFEGGFSGNSSELEQAISFLHENGTFDKLFCFTFGKLFYFTCYE